MSEEQKAKLKDIFEWIYCIIIAVVLALLVRYYVGTPTIVNQTSMYPTFNNNDRLILNRLYRTLKITPQRGDIVTFEAPSVSYFSGEEADLDNPEAIYDNEPQGMFSKFMYNVVEYKKISYIKRVIALPGEHIQIKDGKVYINGEELKEEYLQPGVVTDVAKGALSDFYVPENCVFAMGDNRSQSTDCRAFGCIPLEKIESTVAFRFWPFDVFGAVN